MSWVGPAISVGGGLLSSYLGSKGQGGGDDPEFEKFMAEALANYQAHEKQGRGDIMGGYQQGMSFLSPYMQAGQKGLSDYQASLGEGAGQPGVQGAPQGGGEAQQSIVNQFHQSPGYQFALNQGLNAVQGREAAQGQTGGGGEQKAITRYSQGLADQEYGNYQQRLAGMAQMGQQSSGQAFQGAMGTGQNLANLGLNYARDEGDVYTGTGSALTNERMAAQEGQGGMMGQFMQFLPQLSKMWGQGGSSGGGGDSYYDADHQWQDPDMG